MKQSKSFIFTSKEVPSDIKGISANLLWRGGFIDQLSSGIYSILPLGWRVHQRISQIIREELNNIGGQEIYLPALQPKEIWMESNRWDKMDPPLFKLKDRHNKEFALGSTHEEVITQLVGKKVKSFKELPFMLYQIQVKFRNELRATSGLLRTREFIMQDAYSFHQDEQDFQKYYQQIINAYKNIFKRCGVPTLLVEASSGTIGGKSSHEFMIIAESGEDKIVICPKCNFAANVEVYKKDNCPKCKNRLDIKNCIEIGHIFNLGTQYSKKINANFINSKNQQKPLIMGCYGIGIGRLLASIVEASHDNCGIIWPSEIAPFQIHLIILQNEKRVIENGNDIYNVLEKNKFQVLYDEREISAGQKLVESDLLGIPLRIVISEKTLEKNAVELKLRQENKFELVEISQLIDKIKKMG